MRADDRPDDLADAQARVRALQEQGDGVLIQVGGWLAGARLFHFLVDDRDAPSLAEVKWLALVAAKTQAVYALAPQRDRMLHRVVMSALPGQLVDHRNGNTLDNRRSNLRCANSAQNAMNRRRKRTSGSAFKGVMWEAARGLWVARIKVDGVYRNLGRFRSAESAAWAYDQAALVHFGEFALINGAEDPGTDDTRRCPRYSTEEKLHALAVHDSAGRSRALATLPVSASALDRWVKQRAAGLGDGPHRGTAKLKEDS